MLESEEELKPKEELRSTFETPLEYVDAFHTPVRIKKHNTNKCDSIYLIKIYTMYGSTLCRRWGGGGGDEDAEV